MARVNKLQFLVSAALFALASAAPTATSAAATVTLRIPSTPSADRQCVDPGFQGFSIESVSWMDYSGNSSDINAFVYPAPRALQTLGDQLKALEIGNEYGHDFKQGPRGYVDL
ncbi:hypothetical protein H072_5935 [Dactylellina haptotyla CBS 200.50]|uniref:Uncharacterized protein n=1 Tax=Dactylellina haptotyla (strain CBS 200.50) TaxID=1284197 RepID=S8ABI1_DACHA|nr:hypothetical protein H072_5935 [Dactylellina haptotyla CBS 200.50]